MKEPVSHSKSARISTHPLFFTLLFIGLGIIIIGTGLGILSAMEVIKIPQKATLAVISLGIAVTHIFIAIQSMNNPKIWISVYAGIMAFFALFAAASMLS